MTKNFKLNPSHKKTTQKDWDALASKALRGAPVDKLNRTTVDDIELKPLYTASSDTIAKRSGEIGAMPFIRGEAPKNTQMPPCAILQLIDFTNSSNANEQMEYDLGGGADGFLFKLGGGVPYPGGHLTLTHIRDFALLFEDLNPADMILHFDGGAELIAQLAIFQAFVDDQKLKPSLLKGNLGLDPLALFAAHNIMPQPFDKALAPSIDCALSFKKQKFKMAAFKASSRAWHQAGSSVAQEIALTLSAACAYLRALVDAGETVDNAAQTIEFSLAVGGDLYMNVAKFRSLRGLWAFVLEQSGIQPRAAIIHGELSAFETTRVDSDVNMLRATSATMGASFGGAASMMVMPHTSHSGIATSHARRVARNTQLIAGRESLLDQVQDPTGGSWYVENLTHELCAKAWAIFQTIEQEGGLLNGLQSGVVRKMVDEVRDRRARDLAYGKTEITGVSSFPLLDEAPSEVLEPKEPKTSVAQEVELSLPPLGNGKWFSALSSAAGKGGGLAQLCKAIKQPIALLSLLPRCDGHSAEGFEELRAISDEVYAHNGARPLVYLVTIGRASDYTARATWARGFFEAGGIDVILHEGTIDEAALTKGFQQSGAPICVIASSDKQYEQELANVLTNMDFAGAQHQFVVARPDLLNDLPQGAVSLVGTLLYKGVNRLAILGEIFDMYGFFDQPQ